VLTDVSEEHIASIFRVEKISSARNNPASRWQTRCTLLSCWTYFLTLTMEAICSTETSVDTQQTTRHYIPEDDTLYIHRCENLKSYMEMQLLSSLNSALDGSGWSSSRASRFNPWHSSPKETMDKGFCGLRSLDAVREFICPCRETNPDSSVFQRVAYSLYWLSNAGSPQYLLDNLRNRTRGS
jgi:hypothetical protein